MISRDNFFLVATLVTPLITVFALSALNADGLGFYDLHVILAIIVTLGICLVHRIRRVLLLPFLYIQKALFICSILVNRNSKPDGILRKFVKSTVLVGLTSALFMLTPPFEVSQVFLGVEQSTIFYSTLSVGGIFGLLFFCHLIEGRDVSTALFMLITPLAFWGLAHHESRLFFVCMAVLLLGAMGDTWGIRKNQKFPTTIDTHLLVQFCGVVLTAMGIATIAGTYSDLLLALGLGLTAGIVPGMSMYSRFLSTVTSKIATKWIVVRTISICLILRNLNLFVSQFGTHYAIIGAIGFALLFSWTFIVSISLNDLKALVSTWYDSVVFLILSAAFVSVSQGIQDQSVYILALFSAFMLSISLFELIRLLEFKSLQSPVVGDLLAWVGEHPKWHVLVSTWGLMANIGPLAIVPLLGLIIVAPFAFVDFEFVGAAVFVIMTLFAAVSYGQCQFMIRIPFKFQKELFADGNSSMSSGTNIAFATAFTMLVLHALLLNIFIFSRIVFRGTFS